MQKYFVAKNAITQDKCHISGPDVHHILNVMRYRPGQEVIIGVIGSLTYKGVISLISRDEVVVDLKERLAIAAPAYTLDVAQALIRKERFELFLEKATEFGCTGIIPTLFERSIIKIDKAKTDMKLSRYRMIVKEAAEQSQRDRLPQVWEFTDLNKLDYPAYDRIVVLYEQELVSNHLNKLLPDIPISKKVLIIVGPEGGITPKEKAILEAKQATFVSLGERIYRSESAALMALAVFTSHWGV